MKKFTKIFENAELVSGEYKNLKKIILSEAEVHGDDLKRTISDMAKGFNNEIPIPFTSDELYDIWSKESDSIDAVLSANNWFDEMPSRYGIKSTKIYIIESTKRAFKHICDMLLESLK